MKRKDRKKCMYKLGKETFDFDHIKELSIYNYVVGESMTKNQWKSVSKKIKFESYEAWRNHIVKKYEVYSVESLHEFSRYLKVLIEDSEGISGLSKIVCATLLTFLVTKLFDNFVTNEAITVASLGDKITLLFICIFGAMISSVIILLGAKSIFSMYVKDNKACYFYQDYKTVIDELIEQKKK